MFICWYLCIIFLKDAPYYADLDVMDLLDFSWTKEKQWSARIRRYIIRFKNVVQCFVTLIKNNPNDEFLMRMCRIGDACMEIRNFNGLMQVLTAFSKPDIFPILQNGSALVKNRWATFVELRNDNFQKLRVIHQRAGLPYLPYPGLYLSDLSLLSQKKTVEKSMINFEKLALVATVYDSLFGKQKKSAN